jgi:beta-lactamase superfamily II metal-dependent hydrolase
MRWDYSRQFWLGQYKILMRIAELVLMEIHIFDVEHGNCCIIVFPSGESMMIDCGHNGTTGWRPSNWVLDNLDGDLTDLTISNFDEDHVSDLPNLRRYCNIRSFYHNRDVDVDWLRRIKAASGIGPGIQAAIGMMNEYTGPAVAVDWGGATIHRYYHPLSIFDNTNDLSVVTFIQYDRISIVFPGDISTTAWEVYLTNPYFRSDLAATNIFVASHHGRTDGYCREVFNYCKPAVIIVSDKSIEHQTQREVDYRQHARGITWNQTDTRYVLTTRNDGKMTITSRQSGFHIQASSQL